MSTSRDAILARIRAALADVPASERPDDVPVERGYRHHDDAPRDAIVDLFIDRVSDYGARLRRVAPEVLAQAVADACADRGVHRLLVPVDLPAEWVSRLEGVELLRDEPAQPLSLDTLDASDGALTGCALAIAQTGSIALDGGTAQGRRALTLVPDYHLCVVREDQIVGNVPEAVAALSDAAHARRPMTYISGPSATVDIEFQRVQGVHGPRTLDILLVGLGGADGSD